MAKIEVRVEDISESLKRAHNWTAPGPDKVQNFWFKFFTSVHHPLAKIFNDLINNPEDIPQFLTFGVTYLKPKDNDTKNPAKYRPITCLPTVYKLLTSIISNKIYTHIKENHIISEEQKGCYKGGRGCKEQLIIDSEIHAQARLKHRNLHYAYIDYQKAFDSVPHAWLLHVLKIYKIDINVVHFLQKAMANWTTTLNIKTDAISLKTRNIQIKRGIFQGDSLSPLWFCLALNPLSFMLNSSKYGYVIQKDGKAKITHLLYMDDIKLYGASRHQLNYLLKITETFSKDINMKFGISKCKINSILKGEHANQEPYDLNHQEDCIEPLTIIDTYKYLGFHQNREINHTQIKQELKNKYHHRLVTVLKTGLLAINKIKAINTFAIPTLTYSFGIIRWTDTDLDALNTLTRTTSNKYNIHHIHSATERFTLKRYVGGRGVIDIKNHHYQQVHNLRDYFIKRSTDSPLHKAVCSLNTSGTPLNLNDKGYTPYDKIETEDKKIETWRQKALHGKHPYELKQDYVDYKASNEWLCKGNLFAETEGFMFAIQDRVIPTKNYRKYIIKDPTITTDSCRLCHLRQETIEHITAGCPFLASKQYTDRHNNVARQVHIYLAKKYKLINNIEPYYKYKPKQILENDLAKLYWDRDIVTDKTTINNRPDITLTNKLTKITYLIDISVPNTENIKKKHVEKIQKYIPLAEEIKEMWHQTQVRIIPIIISSTGVIPRSLHTSLSELELPKFLYTNLQKSIIIDTCSIVRKFTNTPPEN